MARFAHGHQPDVDLDLPIDEVVDPSVAPASPSTMPSEETLPDNPTTTRPIGSSFSDLGATFSGMARPPTDASPQSALDQGGQGAGSTAHRTNDLTTVQNNLLAELNTGQFSGAALGHVQAILSDIANAISAANASVSTAGSFGNAASAEQSLRTSQLNIINTVNTDPVLANPAPPAAPLPAGPTAAAAPHNFAEIGAMFDDVANQILGGVNDGNRTQITDDINALISDMQALMEAKPELFDGLTGVHADKIVQQLQLELVYINDPSISPSAAEASNDNILDIIEIVQSDSNLADMATQDGINGFSPFPDAPTPQHLDNGAQTVFWANFIAQSNSLGQQAIDLVGSGDTEAIATLIADLKAFEEYVTDFDAAQGGILDNDLAGATGALGAEIAAMIKGLQTGNVALVTAAADQMHGNAADVGGNNVPATGGSYNTDGVTVAEVLGTPVAETPVAETPAAAAAPAVQQVAAPTISVEQATLAAADVGAGSADLAHSDMPEFAHHLHHMWG